MILRRRNVSPAPAAFSFPHFHCKKKHLLEGSVIFSIFFLIDGSLSVWTHLLHLGWVTGHCKGTEWLLRKHPGLCGGGRKGGQNTFPQSGIGLGAGRRPGGLWRSFFRWQADVKCHHSQTMERCWPNSCPPLKVFWPRVPISTEVMPTEKEKEKGVGVPAIQSEVLTYPQRQWCFVFNEMDFCSQWCFSKKCFSNCGSEHTRWATSPLHNGHKCVGPRSFQCAFDFECIRLDAPMKYKCIWGTVFRPVVANFTPW